MIEDESGSIGALALQGRARSLFTTVFLLLANFMYSHVRTYVLENIQRDIWATLKYCIY